MHCPQPGNRKRTTKCVSLATAAVTKATTNTDPVLFLASKSKLLLYKSVGNGRRAHQRGSGSYAFMYAWSRFVCVCVRLFAYVCLYYVFWGVGEVACDAFCISFALSSGWVGEQRAKARYELRRMTNRVDITHGKGTNFRTLNFSIINLNLNCY